MISRVRRENQKLLDFLQRLFDEDIEAVLERSPAFQFYASDWLSSGSTSYMDAEQQGWFLNLLCRAWWDGSPQSTLPGTNEDLLKRWAKYKIPDYVTTERQSAVDHPSNYEGRWAEVRAKWLPVPGHQTFLYNPKLSRVLMETLEYRLQQRTSSLRGVQARLVNKGLTTDRQPGVDQRSTVGQSSVNRRSTSSTSTSTSTSTSNEKDFQTGGKVSDKLWESEVVGNDDEEEEKTQRRKLFSPTKFQVNEKMLIWFQDKYPEFNGGDVKYLTDRFVNVYTGRRAFSFTRAWYNFVDKEIVQIGYRPGQYDWKTSDSRPAAGGKKDVHETADKLRAETEAKIRDHQPAQGDIFALLSPEDD